MWIPITVFSVLAAAAGLIVWWLASPGAGDADDSGGARVADDDDFGTVHVYDVDEAAGLSPAPSGLASEIWDMFVRVATPEYAGEKVVEYHVGDSDESDTMAFVFQADDPAYWVVGANLATSEDRQELLATLVHEYAHLLFLSTDQIDLDGECAADDALWEGCPLAHAYVAAFRDEFWSHYGDDAPASDNTDGDVAYDFYLAHEDDFVSDYAATNPIEDAAESFTAFVLEETPELGSVVARKMLFFSAYPELVEIRERIRAEFSGEHGLP